MRFLWSLAFGLCVLTSPVAAEESPHAVLEHWVGDWTGGAAGGPKGSLEHIAATPDHAEVRWTLDEKFVQGTNLDASGKPVGIWMMRYDTGTESYQVIFFIASGSVSVWTGEWDEADLTMTWEALDNDSGVVGTGTTRFVNGVQEWTLSYPQDGQDVSQSGMLTKR